MAVFVGLLLLLVFDLALIAARAAYLQSNTARLLAMREQSDARVGKAIARAMAFINNLPRLRASLNLALVLARFFLAGLLLLLIALQFAASSVWINAAALLALAGLLFGLEWSVEHFISRTPEVWALRLAAFVGVWTLLTFRFLSPLVGKAPAQIHPEMPGMVTEDDLKTLVDVGQEDGALEQDERRMIFSVFELGDTLAREIMIPRIDVVGLDAQSALSQAVDTVLEYGHSRLPVYEETIDQTLGLLYAKDLLRAFREAENTASAGGPVNSLRDLLRPAYFVPEAKKVDELLAEMQSQRIHMAIVVDEYGGVAGLVTMEDIVEEIVGEIQDEYDQEEEAPFQEVEAGEFVFQGRVDLDDFNETMAFTGSSLPTDDADTLGGFIYSELGRVPTVGEKIKKENLLLIVEQVSARRIRKVRACWLHPAAQGNEDIAHHEQEKHVNG